MHLNENARVLKPGNLRFWRNIYGYDLYKLYHLSEQAAHDIQRLAPHVWELAGGHALHRVRVPVLLLNLNKTQTTEEQQMKSFHPGLFVTVTDLCTNTVSTRITFQLRRTRRASQPLILGVEIGQNGIMVVWILYGVAANFTITVNDDFE